MMRERVRRALPVPRDRYMTCPKHWHTTILLLLFAASCQSGFADDQRTATVGMSARIKQIKLPGSELEAKPLDDSRSPVVLRVAGSFAHGTDYRYDLVYYGLEPGTYDLKNYLRRKDGSATDDLPAISVEIKPVLPPGQVEPNQLESKASSNLGGYRMMLIVGGIVWFIGIFVILFAWRGKAKDAGLAEISRLSLADRLRPMVQNAMKGELDEIQKAELERMLLAFWRRQLNLDELKAVDAIAKLRQHEEAGDLLRKLEMWLHRPGQHDEVDLAELLKPYEAVSPTQV